MVPALTAMAQTQRRPVRRPGVISPPERCDLSELARKEPGRGFQFSPVLAPLEPFRDTVIVITGLAAIRPRRSATAAAITARVGDVSHGRPRPQVRQRRRERRVDGTIAAKCHQRRDAAVLAPADRGRQQPCRIVRCGLQLRVQQHAVVAHAHAASDGGEQPAGLRTAVRIERAWTRACALSRLRRTGAFSIR